MRIGNGFDVHRLEQGRPLIMGGVEIPYDKGLLGHSDADVLVHSIMDGMLGALALGDIGQHFPDSDPQYKGISSISLLEKVNKLILNYGYKVGNIDSIICAQNPKFAPHINKMRENISQAIGVDVKQVSVKATTTEKLGFEGRGEGISAYAVVILEEETK
ncbi:MAG: 2-C-methyl-D-erythritol 2,4-cyclodiphosphate synthase [Clostridia bacterium]|nr:2-C-methyl-D-erythritol 2,4-cyclodiphosphate synthase [Clostridia bacterium]